MDIIVAFKTYTCNTHKINIDKRIKNIYIDTELVLPMCNVHPSLSLKTLDKKSAHYTWQNIVHTFQVHMEHFQGQTTARTQNKSQ